MVNSRRAIPLAHSLLTAGPAVQLDAEGFVSLDINALVCGGKEGCLAFIVTGDSMRDEILPGFVVFVDPEREVRSGDTVAVSINNETCIKVFQREQQRLYLVPRNGEYATREIKRTDDLHMIGVVVGHLSVY